MTVRLERRLLYIFELLKQGRRKTTIIQNLPNEFLKKSMVSELNKSLHCTGAIIEDKNYGKIIKLTGDHKMALIEILLDLNVTTEENIKIHGV